MVLVAILASMLGLCMYGKRIKKFSSRHYLLAALVTLLQVSVAVYAMFTMERPPLF